MNRHIPRTIALALGLTLAGAVPATANTQAAAPVACVIANPTISNNRFCAKVEVGRPSIQWYSLGQLQSRDGKKYKLTVKDVCGTSKLLINWTTSVAIGEWNSNCAPSRATVTYGDGSGTVNWNIHP